MTSQEGHLPRGWMKLKHPGHLVQEYPGLRQHHTQCNLAPSISDFQLPMYGKHLGSI